MNYYMILVCAAYGFYTGYKGVKVLSFDFWIGFIIVVSAYCFGIYGK